MEGAVQCSANYTPLTPVSFLERAANVYGEKVSIIYGADKTTWGETHKRCIKLASALVHLGISRGDIVSHVFFFSIFTLHSSCLMKMDILILNTYAET